MVISQGPPVDGHLVSAALSSHDSRADQANATPFSIAVAVFARRSPRPS